MVWAAGAGELAAQEDEGEEAVGEKDAQLGEPIVGKNKSMTLGTEGGRALTPVPLSSPKEPTATERRLHELTHLPYASWCPHCVSCRRPNTQHRSSKQERSLPLLLKMAI